MRFLVLTLRGPMMSFGGAVIDGIGNTGRLPRLSALTGLLANALGYDRTEAGRLADLQGNIVFAAREDISGHLETDFQTAKIAKNDKGWTRFGVDERGGGAGTYDSPNIMTRPYLAGHAVTVVIGFSGGEVDVDHMAEAMRNPARPLFLGRKSFPPSAPLVDATRPVIVEAQDALAALSMIPAAEGGGDKDLLACWPEGCGDQGRQVEARDIRDFVGNRHAGQRTQMEGRISVATT